MKLPNKFFLSKVPFILTVNTFLIDASLIVKHARTGSTIGLLFENFNKGSIFSSLWNFSTVYSHHLTLFWWHRISQCKSFILKFIIILGIVNVAHAAVESDPSYDNLKSVEICTWTVKVVRNGPHKDVFVVKCEDYWLYYDLMERGRIDEARRLLTPRPL